MANHQKKTKKKGGALLNVLIVICFLVAAGCAGYLGKYAYDYYVASRDFGLLADDYHAHEGKSAAKNIAYLSKKNPDCVGWIHVDDTRIDYPVMLTPKEPEYYLHRNFEKNWSANGVPFMGEGCNTTSNSIILYGHHMNDGSMFAQLSRFDKIDFAKSHDIVFTTKQGEGHYKVVAAYYADLTRKDVFKYWDMVGNLDEERMTELVQTMRGNSLYQTKAAVTPDSKLLMLATCSYGTRDERFVVLSVKQ